MDAPLTAALEVLERRLDPRARAPVAVAFSGGGDSLAVLLAARAYADRHGRRLAVLHVDHGLQAASAGWAAEAAGVAARLGAAFHRLDWRGDKPAAGLPAAGRQARHRLIAEAARSLDASVVLMGHTLDDQLENALMRAAGAPVGALREWSPSPVWPQGRGLFLCRPLLAQRRADLRAWLAGRGWSWIDDPANADSRHPRVQARAAVARGEQGDAIMTADVRALAAAAVRAAPWGGFAIDRAGLLAAPAAQALRLLQIALACAAGVEGLPRPARAGTLLGRMAAGEVFVATLGGARLQANGDVVLVGREAGELARGGLQPQALGAGEPVAWDGRFEIVADEPGWTVQALRGQSARLGPETSVRLRTVPAWARPTLPVLRSYPVSSATPRLALSGPGAHIGRDGPRCRALCEERFRAAAGLVNCEVETGMIAGMALFPQPNHLTAGQ